jgi:hypothetical protein
MESALYFYYTIPQDLQKVVDDLAGEDMKVNDKIIKEMDEKIKKNDILIEFLTRLDAKLDEDAIKIERQLENVRELNRQLGIT